MDFDVIRKIQASTCAVVRVTTDPKQGSLADCEIVGAAFLSGPGIAVTNRQVVDPIMADHIHGQSIENWYVRFTTPREDGGFSHSFLQIEEVSPIFLQGHKGLNASHVTTDVALLSFDYGREDPARFAPVAFGALDDVKVGEDVGICALPVGDSTQDNLTADLLYRVPYLHLGKVARVTPYGHPEDPRSINLILTDLSTADGLIGAPVFLPEQGRVIGLHCGTIHGLLGIAIPVDRDRVESWITYHEAAMQDPEATIPMMINRGGDLIIGHDANERSPGALRPSMIAGHDSAIDHPFHGTKSPA